MIQLRPYQSLAINQMRELMRQGCKSILYQGATGSGKTALTAHMLHTAAGKGLRSLFVCHRRELIKQSADAFNQEGLEYGIISAGFSEDSRHDVQLGSIQTLVRRARRIRPPTLIVWDECHHLAAKSWTGLFQIFPGAFHIGLSATPQRLDGQGLGAFFKKMVCGPSVRSLMEQGYLSPYKLYAPAQPDTSKLHIRMGDYEKKELETLIDRPSIVGDAVSHYKRLAMGKRAIVFAVSIKHSQHIVEKFNQEGIHAEHVDGETPTEERDAAVERFKSGETIILSNVDLFGEGFNVPMAECAILLRPTQSLSLYLQAIGRVLRPGVDKIATILDHAGNCRRHGLPDEDRQWSLAGRENGTRGSVNGMSVRVCASCFAAMPGGLTACKYCGFVFPVQPREVPQKEGELEEITAIKRQARQEQGMAYSLNDLIALGKQRNYKNPYFWAKMVFNARQARKIGRVA